MKRIKAHQIVYIVLLGVFSLVMLYPFIYMFLGAFTTPREFAASGILPIPKGLGSGRISEVLKLFTDRAILDSVLFTLGRIMWYIVWVLFTSVLLGYVFAKIDFSGKNFVFMYFMVSMMVPGVATIIPTFVLFSHFPLAGGNNIAGLNGHGLINEWPVMFITGLFGIYNVFLVRQSFVGLGNEYKEAAEIDGAGFLRIVFAVYMPMILPVLTIITVGLCIGLWNDYFFSLMYADGNVIKPIGYYITQVIAQYNQSQTIYPEYPAILGISFVFVLLPVIFYVCLQKHFTKGLSMGGIKG